MYYSFLFLLILGYYSWDVSRESLWFDEVGSALLAEHSLKDLLALSQFDKHPPLFYILLKLVMALTGTTEAGIRFLSVLGATLLVMLGVGSVKKLFGSETAFYYLIFTLSSPSVFSYAHEARMYSLLMFTATATSVWGLLAFRDNKKSYFLYLGLFAGFSVYLHYFGVLVVFYLFFFFFLYSLIYKREVIKGFLLTATTVFFLFLPWLFLFYRQFSEVRAGYWIPTVTAFTVIRAFLNYFSYKDLYFGPFTQGNYTIDLSSGCIADSLLAILLIVCWIGKGTFKKDKEYRLPFFFPFLVTVFTVITAVIVSKLITPVFFGRHMLVCAGLIFISLSHAVKALPRTYLKYTVLILFIVFGSLSIREIHVRNLNGPAKKILQDSGIRIGPSELIISSSSLVMGPMFYYFNTADHFLIFNEKENHLEKIFKIYEPKLRFGKKPSEIIKNYPFFWLANIKGIFEVKPDEFLSENRDFILAERKIYYLESSKYTIELLKFIR